MREQAILQRLMLACSRFGWRVFRNNVGVLRDSRGVPVVFGLCPGSSDLIGWRSVKITNEMVGTQIAQFVSIEAKTPKGRLTQEQANWIATVQASGGLAIVARSEDDITPIK